MVSSDDDVSSQPDPEEVPSTSDAEEEDYDGKRKKSSTQAASKRRQCGGGVKRVGCKGQLRSLGKYGDALAANCPDCGGPHQAALQARDSILHEFMAEVCQIDRKDLNQHIRDWHGEHTGGHLTNNIELQQEP